jgi:hypothetical protein
MIYLSFILFIIFIFLFICIVYRCARSPTPGHTKIFKLYDFNLNFHFFYDLYSAGNKFPTMSINFDSTRVKNANNWARMLIDDKAKQALAPALAPSVTSYATIVRSFDVPYADTLDSGYFTFVLSTDPTKAYLKSTTTSYPAGGYGPVMLKSYQTTTRIGEGQSTINSGQLVISSGSSADIGFVDGMINVIPDLGTISALRAGQGGIPFLLANGSTCLVTINPAIGGYYSVWTVAAGGAILRDGPTTYCSSYSGSSITVTATQDAHYLMIACVSSAGVQGTASRDIPVSVEIQSLVGQVVNATVAHRSGAVSSELLEQGNLSHVRCTAMNLLVTNMASPLESGGEIVVARVHEGFLRAPNTAALMEDLKALPEKRYWRSGPLKDGGYTWYLPDDLSSYEPLPLHSQEHDNVLVAAVKMSDEAGQVRINCTQRWEFYTPAQILPRKLTYAWCDYSTKLYEELLSRDACSANAGHAALISAIVAGLGAAANFYGSNRDWIDPAVGAVVKQAQHLLAKPKENKNKEAKKTKKPPARVRVAPRQGTVFARK